MARSITLAEAARITRNRDGEQLAQNSLRAAAARGALHARKVGGVWVTTEADVRDYLATRPRWWKPRTERMRS